MSLLNNGFIYERLDVAACADASKVGVIACGAHTVAQENVEHVVLGINPETGARETGMTERLGCGLGTGVAGIGVAHDRLVKSQTTVAIRTLLSHESLNG